MELEEQDMYFPLPTLMGIGRYWVVSERWTQGVDDYGCQGGPTCDVDGNYVSGHGPGRQPHLLLWGGEGCALVPLDPSVPLIQLPSFAPSLRGLGPHGELRFVVLR